MLHVSLSSLDRQWCIMNCEIQSCIYSNYILTLCSIVYSLRFDLIFLMLDPQDEFYDRRLATHLVSLYHQTQEEEEEEFLVSKRTFFSTSLWLCFAASGVP